MDNLIELRSRYKLCKLLFDWMEQWRQPSDDDQVIRGTLGRLLFTQDRGNQQYHLVLIQ
jgi:ATPase subunit of ABC transporter with duplicated ATPase domains